MMLYLELQMEKKKTKNLRHLLVLEILIYLLIGAFISWLAVS